jgi:hypothetical protein
MNQWPPASELTNLWKKNKDSLIAFIEASHIGITLLIIEMTISSSLKEFQKLMLIIVCIEC